MATVAAGIGYGDTVAYLAVQTSLAETILRDGYKATKRDAVPCAFTPEEAVAARFSHYPDDKDVIVIEVFGISDDKLDRCAGKIRVKHLTPEHLRSGCVIARDSSEHQDVPCPFCRELIPEAERAAKRGKVGVHRYVDGAFAASPCCAERCVVRQARLQNGMCRKLYHQTSKTTAQRIYVAGGKMVRGSGGVAGGGIYFAESARETEWKWEAKDPSEPVVLECEVRVGTVKEVGRDGDRGITFASLASEDLDSVLCDRGKCEVEGPHKGKPSGNEVIVYSWDQVRVLREVPRDPVPA